jgi:hypothetical protein
MRGVGVRVGVRAEGVVRKGLAQASIADCGIVPSNDRAIFRN